MNLYVLPYDQILIEFGTMKVMYILLVLFTFLTLSTDKCNGSLVGWLLGRDNSPFSILNSDKDFDKLLTKTEQANGLPPHQHENEENAIQSKTDIPFELSVADEKFIADAQKFTDLNLSELDVCQHKVNNDFLNCF